jgi:CRISPR-associated protein Csx17
MSELPLLGCTPEPLMNYLKALGILRLVTEQADRAARGAWRDGTFVLRSKFDREALERFFLNDYCPTPIVAPWAGGSGFFAKDNRQAVDALAHSGTPRLEAYRDVIGKVRAILREERIKDKPSGEDKERLLRRYRRELPDLFLPWIDAAMAIQAEGQSFAPILGTGGNDGRLDFTLNFMQRLVTLGIPIGKPAASALGWLRQALWGEPTNGLLKAAVGQFAPGRAGGPNATQGMEGSSRDNPWDFVLMLEGAPLLAGAVARRMGVQCRDRAVFPFTVRAAAVGLGCESEFEEARGEIWLPVWRSFAALSELKILFAEGRAEISGRPALNAVDFARAVAGLGVDRGIGSFARFGFLKRSGKAYLAPALGAFDVERREPIDLLRQTDAWLDRFRAASANPNAPGRFSAALRRTERAIFDYCRYGGTPLFAEILCALGAAERELAVREGKISGDDACHPLGGLSPDWLAAAHDGSPEFELALSLAGIYDGENKLGPLRANLEPFDWQKPYPDWAEKNRTAVWNSADLTTNLAAVLERRLLDGERSGCESLPLNFKRAASLEAIAAFLSTDGVNDRRLDELLWGLTLVDHRQEYPQVARVRPDAPSLPRAYALVKLLFLPYPLVRKRQEHGRAIWRLATGDEPDAVHISPEPQILPVLRSRRPDSIPEACMLAMRRLRFSGLKPLPYRTGGGRNRDDAWADAHGVDPKRLAAALLFPVGSAAINDLIQLVTRRDEELEPVTQAEGENEL